MHEIKVSARHAFVISHLPKLTDDAGTYSREKETKGEGGLAMQASIGELPLRKKKVLCYFVLMSPAMM
jgi:hypothetical protein